MADFKPAGKLCVAAALQFFDLRSLEGRDPAATKARHAVSIVLSNYGWSSGRIAALIGKSTPTVRANLRSARRDPELAAAVRHVAKALL